MILGNFCLKEAPQFWSCSLIDIVRIFNSPLHKRESFGASFLYWLVENLNISIEMLMNEKLSNQV